MLKITLILLLAVSAHTMTHAQSPDALKYNDLLRDNKFVPSPNEFTLIIDTLGNGMPENIFPQDGSSEYLASTTRSLRRLFFLYQSNDSLQSTDNMTKLIDLKIKYYNLLAGVLNPKFVQSEVHLYSVIDVSEGRRSPESVQRDAGLRDENQKNIHMNNLQSEAKYQFDAAKRMLDQVSKLQNIDAIANSESYINLMKIVNKFDSDS